MTKIKLVACDMDGTFLNSDRDPHPKNIAAAKALISTGVTFCLASGRGISTMRPLMTELSLTGPVVSSNGAHILCPQGEDLHQATLPPDVVESLVRYAQANNIHLNRYHGNTITFSDSGPHGDMYRRRTGCVAEIARYADLAALPATKLLFVGLPNEIAEHTALISQSMSPTTVSIVRSEPEYLEFLPTGINKGTGLKMLATHLGLEPHNCAAIGDWHNDLEMLNWVGYPAAVSNATEEIKNVAEKVFASNDEAGVADFILSVIQRNETGYSS